MCKINVYSKLVIERFPNARNLFALCDRVRRNKGRAYRSILHQFGSLIVPPCHIVNFARSFIWFAFFIYINGKNIAFLFLALQTSVYKGYKRDKIEMRGDRAEMSDFPLYLNTVAGGLDRRDQAISGFSFVVKIYAVPVVEIIG